ncbi:MAG: hypothetical protein IJQ37_04525 [Clostridia bacterium]|nr:hypothetical protein [Clostridia bacterium]
MATFQNQALLSYNGVTTASNIVSGEILDTLAVTKTAVEPSYSAGGNITYVVSLINSGATAFTDITLTDDLGLYTVGTLSVRPLDYVDGSVMYYVGGVLQTAPTATVGADGELVISGISVPAGSNATVIYAATVNDTAPLAEGSTIVNTVSAAEAGMTPVVATESVGVRGGAILSIGKAVSPASVAENGRITYTFVISNSGGEQTTTEGNPVITDTFSPILSDIVVTLNGAPIAEGTGYTYDETTGLFTTADGIITVPAATFTQDPTTGVWSVTPGTVTLTVTGTI